MVRVRFAPSPTGSLHIGGARTALFNYLFAKQHKGTFILRIEDTDKERSLPVHEKNILDSMRWLGLTWDEGVGANGGSDDVGPYGPYRQSERLSKHLALAEQLKKSSAAYVDSENCVRLKYPEGVILVEDLILGECRFTADSLGPDPVILRSDGTPTFHLANVADDIDMKVSHIIRGADHLTNSAKHVVLFQAAGADVPKFGHMPLILGSDGSKLSKRNSTGFTTVDDFKNAGYLPDALMNFISLLGWSHPEGQDVFSIEDIVSLFSLERVNNSGAKFELSKLDWYNAHYLRAKSNDDLGAITLPWTGAWRSEVERRGTTYWAHAISSLKTDFERLTQVEDVAKALCIETTQVSEEAKSFFDTSEARTVISQVKTELLSAFDTVPLSDGEDCYSLEQIKSITKFVRKAVDAPPKLVFQSIRVLITGEMRGAELDSLLPFVPRTVLESRVRSTSY